MRRLVWAVVCVMMAAGVSAGDIVYLKDGTRREGKVVKETETEVVLEMTLGGITAAVRFPREQVERIEQTKTQRELLEEEFAKRRAGLKAGDVDGMEALAKWCIEGALYEQATKLYEEMSATGEAGLKRGKLGQSKMEFGRGRTATAMGIAEELKKTLPEDKDVSAWVEELRKARAEEAKAAVKSALEQQAAGRPDRALKVLEGLVDRVGLEGAKEAFGEIDTPGGKTGLLETLAVLRLGRKCAFCELGRVPCKDCKGSGRTETEWLCPTCQGLGYTPCKRCEGTGIQWDAVPVEERGAVLKQLLSLAEEADKSLETLRTTIQEEKTKAAELTRSVAEVQYQAKRVETLRKWALGLSGDVGMTQEIVKKQGEGRQRVGEILMAAGGRLEGLGTAAVKEVNEAKTSYLKNDRKLRDAHEALQWAKGCYEAIDMAKVRLTGDPRRSAKDLDGTLKSLEEILERNSAIARVYETAIAAAKEEKLADALKLLEELVNKAPRPDVDYIAEQHKKNSPLTLAEFMAKIRFEIGKEKRHGFGVPTEYEKAAFAELLLNEASAKSREASQRYDEIMEARLRGKGTLVNPGTVRAVQELAEDARNWYEALLATKYPLREGVARQIEETIDDMERIISRCKRWYAAPTPVPAGP